MLVLGIESSCDETGVALYAEHGGLLAHALHSQIETHRVFGGVVPELASRDHIVRIIPLIDQVLQTAGVDKHQLNAIAYTAGPGLIGALLVGASVAKSMAFALNIPAIAVHHLEAHVMAAKLDTPELTFPFTALLVSGGHTQLIDARGLGDYQLLGETLDDAVGEAFDKTAKRMGLPYPGGPQLAALAAQPLMRDSLPPFPRPMLRNKGLDFSFSGLKTHAMMAWLDSEQGEADRVAVAHAFQDAVIETLCVKCERALDATGSQKLVVAGGVSANYALRGALNTMASTRGAEVYFPRLDYCTDNGAMVAYTGYLYASQGMFDSTHAIDVRARWPLVNLAE